MRPLDVRGFLETGSTRLAAVCDAGPGASVTSLAAASDGRVLAGHADGRVVLWDVVEPRVVSGAEAGGPIDALAWAADGRAIVVAAGGVQRWTPGERLQPVSRLPDAARVVGLAADGATVLLARDERLLVVDALSGVTLDTLELPASVLVAALSADARRVFGATATTEYDDEERRVGHAGVWSRGARSPTPLPEVGAEHVDTIAEHGPALTAAFGPDGVLRVRVGRSLAVGPRQLEAWLDGSSLELVPGPSLRDTVEVDPSAGALATVSFDPDGRWVLVGTAAGLLLRFALRHAACTEASSGVPLGLLPAEHDHLRDRLATELRTALAGERSRALALLVRLWPEIGEALDAGRPLPLAPAPPPEQWENLASVFVIDTTTIEAALETGEPARYVVAAARAVSDLVSCCETPARRTRLLELLRGRLPDRRQPPGRVRSIGADVQDSHAIALVEMRRRDHVSDAALREEVLAAIDRGLERGSGISALDRLFRRVWCDLGLGPPEDLAAELLRRLEDAERPPGVRLAILRGELLTSPGALEVLLRVAAAGPWVDRVREAERQAIARVLRDRRTPAELRAALDDLLPRYGSAFVEELRAAGSAPALPVPTLRELAAFAARGMTGQDLRRKHVVRLSHEAFLRALATSPEDDPGLVVRALDLVIDVAVVSPDLRPELEARLRRLASCSLAFTGPLWMPIGERAVAALQALKVPTSPYEDPFVAELSAACVPAAEDLLPILLDDDGAPVGLAGERLDRCAAAARVIDPEALVRTLEEAPRDPSRALAAAVVLRERGVPPSLEERLEATLLDRLGEAGTFHPTFRCVPLARPLSVRGEARRVYERWLLRDGDRGERHVARVVALVNRAFLPPTGPRDEAHPERILDWALYAVWSLGSRRAVVPETTTVRIVDAVVAAIADRTISDAERLVRFEGVHHAASRYLGDLLAAAVHAAAEALTAATAAPGADEALRRYVETELPRRMKRVWR